MLDIHPPHESTHTWTDFFIHIATIVIGLFIAIGLEQTVEAIHHHHERHQLLEDLRAETELRIQRLKANERYDAEDIAYYRELLRLGREGTVSGGYVSFTLPYYKKSGYISDTPNGVLVAAKASGAISVLSRSEIELWEHMEVSNEIVANSINNREIALRAFFGVAERTGIRFSPGPVRMSVVDRDELMHAIAQLVEATWQLERDSAMWQGACEGALHGVMNTDELNAYELRVASAMLK